jgi:hypothetical protein
LSATQFRLKNNVSVGISAGATLNSYYVPQNSFARYTSAAGATNSSTTVTVSSTTGLAEGMMLSVVSGTGTLRAGTLVSKVIDATTFIISLAPTVNLSNNAVLSGTPVITNYCPHNHFAGLTSEVDYSVIATPVNNIGYRFLLSKGARISRIGDSAIVGYDTATTTALTSVYTTSNSIGVVFELNNPGVTRTIRVFPYNNAGTGQSHLISIRKDDSRIYNVTSTSAAINNTVVRYKASVANGSEITGYRWTIPPLYVTPLSGSINGLFVTTTTDTLSLMFGNLFRSGSLRVQALTLCSDGYLKSFSLNGTTTLNKVGNEYELIEEIEPTTLSINKLAVYPNPNQTNFTLSVVGDEKEASANVSILNMIGQVVAEYTLDNNNGVVLGEINHNLTPGLYFVQVRIGSTQNTIKIIVNN